MNLLRVEVFLACISHPSLSYSCEINTTKAEGSKLSDFAPIAHRAKWVPINAVRNGTAYGIQRRSHLLPNRGRIKKSGIALMVVRTPLRKEGRGHRVSGVAYHRFLPPPPAVLLFQALALDVMQIPDQVRAKSTNDFGHQEPPHRDQDSVRSSSARRRTNSRVGLGFRWRLNVASCPCGCVCVGLFVCYVSAQRLNGRRSGALGSGPGGQGQLGWGG